jgi:hypothetical protein
VYAQPRDVGFPTLIDQVRKAGAQVLVLQFGRSEALEDPANPERFHHAYAHLLDTWSAPKLRLWLVTPPPFENAGAPLPDLSARNQILSKHVDIILNLGRERRLPVVDLFAELGAGSQPGLRLTVNGLQLSPKGHALAARAFAYQIGLETTARRAGEPDDAGRWPDAALEAVRQAVIAKNHVWFNYSRPQNWAFLGGDRVSQPSSRDHRNPNRRWFPAEIEQFVPLIETAEREIATQAARCVQTSPSPASKKGGAP